jgi:far upstream element-binding protein
MAEFGFNNEYPADNQPATTTADFVTEEMECPHNKVGMVIGSKGVIIQEIMHRTNCKIVVYQDGLPDGQPRTVVINGPANQVGAAKQLINAVIQEGPTILQTQAPGVNSNEPTITEEMSCPAEKVGLVIGSKGVIIQEIMRRSYCKITVNQNFPDGEPRVVNITGKAPQIEIAKTLVSLVIANGPSALSQSHLGVTPSSNITEEMDCPQEKVGIVIGAKGVIVQDIMRRCGCKITINQDFPDGQPRRVVFTGSPQQVEMGKSLVNAVIAHGPTAVQNMGGRGDIVQDLKIVQSQVGKLIGPGGSTIKDIQQRCGVKMNVDQIVPESDERRLRITGDSSRVNAAAQMVFQVLHGGGNMNMNHQQGYGMPMVGGYGNEGGAMMHPGYGMPPGGYGNTEAMQQIAVGQGLGADGTSGRLMPPTPYGANGAVLQVVYILKNLLSQIAGKDFATLALIMSKSAAQVQILQEPVVSTSGVEMCKINVIGAPASVTLAGQMIQEVLINGPEKLAALPDPVYNGMGGEQQNVAQHQQFSQSQQFNHNESVNGNSEYMNMPQQGQMYQGHFYGNANGAQQPYNTNPYYQQQQGQQGQQHQQQGQQK